MTKRAGRFISLLLSLCLLLGLLPTALAAEPELTRAELALMIYEKFLPAAPDGELPTFPDLDGCTPEQQKAIQILAAAGIVAGKETGEFDPEGGVLRFEAVLVLWNALGRPASNAPDAYQDVPAFAAIPVNALYERGILTDGDAVEGAYRPYDAATEADVAAWLSRVDRLTRAEFARLLYEKFRPAALPPEDKPVREEDFPDIGPVEAGEEDPCTDAQRTAIAALYAAYILDGQSDGNFNPKGSVTRAEAVVLMWRAAGRGDATGSPSDIFNNVPANYQPAFDYLVSLGILTESDAVDGDFGLTVLASYEDVTDWLDRLITRAELAEEIAKKFELTPQEGEPAPFIDIKECTAEQQAAINALAQAGIVSGTGPDRFAPNLPVTSASAAIVLCRAASGDYTVRDLELALAYLEAVEILAPDAAELVSALPNNALPPIGLHTWLSSIPDGGLGARQELELSPASEGRMVVQIRPETPLPGDTAVQVLVARYDGGRMTALDMQEVTAEGLYLLTLSDGSGTTYRVFLLDGAESTPLCPAAQASN